MTRQEWKELEEGDIVAKFSSGEAYMVTRKETTCYRGYMYRNSIYGMPLIQNSGEIRIGSPEKVKIIAKKERNNGD